MSTAAGKITVACPKCGKNLLVPASVAGKQGRCPACQNVFLISAPPPVYEEDLEPIPELAPLDNGTFGAPAPAGFAPLGNDPFAHSANNPFAPSASSAFTLPPAQPQQYYQNQASPQQTPVNPYMASAAADPYGPKKGGTDGDWGVNAGMGGGLLLMIGAVVWFFVALFAFDVIFFYPPIMFIIGLVAFIKGIAGKFS